MRYKFIIFFILALFSIVLSKTGVFGSDDRVMLKDVCDDDVITAVEYEALAHSICAVVKKSYIDPKWLDGGTVTYPQNGFNLSLYGTLDYDILVNQGNSACSDVKFKDEYLSRGVIGSGCCIGDRSILTASHLFYDANGVEQNPADYAVIFCWLNNDFKVWDSPLGTYAKNIGPYYYFNIIGYDTDPKNNIPLKKIGGRDISILKTDRMIDPNIIPLVMYQEDDLKTVITGKEIFAIGHPRGLPLIISQKSKINPTVTFSQASNQSWVKTGGGFASSPSLTQTQFDHLCIADIDAFGGNSGCPIFVKDKNFKWVVIGVLGGGNKEWTFKSTCWSEYVTDEAEFNNGTNGSWFWTLQHINFNRTCMLDCPTIDIQEYNPDHGTIKNGTVRGQTITVTLPEKDKNGNPFGIGIYTVIFSNDITVVSKTVVRTQNGWSSKNVSAIVQSKHSYRVLLCALDETIVYDFNISGIANGDALLYEYQVEHSLNKEGVNTNTFCFVPNITTGPLPLLVSFVPNIPNNQPIATWNWNFGDGATSSEMYPSHIYSKAGVFTVWVTATTTSGTNLSYSSPNCINIPSLVSNSFLNQPNISSSNELYLQDVNTQGETGTTTCSSPKEVIVEQNTVIKEGSSVILSIQ